MAKAVKKTQELTLEQVLWNCRVDLRGVGSLDKNRDAVISLVFLKFAGDKFEKRRKAISVIGQESVQETWRLCKMNLAIRGISHNLGKQNASTFTDDQHKDKKVDFIMANPPFNLKRWWADKLAKDPRWSGYGTPRESNANYAWILHMISKLDVNHGIAGFLLANGALSDSDDAEIRKNILLKDKVEAIIVLPRDMFYTTDISVTLWILNMNKL